MVVPGAGRGRPVGEVQTGFSEPVIAHWMYIAVWDRRGRVARIVPHPADRSGLRPAAVNAHGVVVGRLSGTAVAEQDFPVEAILWAPDGRGVRTLGEGRASDINDRGEVVGSTEEGRAVLWTPSGAVDLGQGYAAAINNRGQVVGVTTVPVSGWPEPSTGFFSSAAGGRR